MAFNERGGRVTRLIQPNELMYMMDVEALPEMFNFALGVRVQWQI